MLFLQKIQIIASSIFRPSHQAVEYYCETMMGLNDPVPGNNKEFLVRKGSTYAEIGKEHWEQVVDWLDRSFS
jgi:hypothetical protein